MKARSLLKRVKIVLTKIAIEPSILRKQWKLPNRVFRQHPRKTIAWLKRISSHSYYHDEGYRSWLEVAHNPKPHEKEAMRSWAEGLHKPPIISVIMPVFEPNLPWLEEAILSVKNQLYPHWELCIADDCSINLEVRQLLEKEQANDHRIKIIFREINGHISECSNSAIDLVTGDWIALLDQDDLLAPEALIWIAKTILERPNTKLIYTDEDKISEKGNRYAPYFKPDWNPALIYSQNFFSHLGVYRTELVRQVGGFRKEYDGSQDYDLILRCTDHTDQQDISHIPRVLYHWRVHQQSTASGNQAKPYVLNAAKGAITDSLRRSRQSGTVEITAHGYDIKRSYSDDSTIVNVLLDGRSCSTKEISKCLRGIEASTKAQLHLHLVLTREQHKVAKKLNQSKRSLFSLMQVQELSKDMPTAEVLTEALQSCNGSKILLWDRRLQVQSSPENECDWIHELIAELEIPNVVGAGPKLVYKCNRIYHAGLILSPRHLAVHCHHGLNKDDSGYFGRANLAQNFSILSPYGLALNRQVIEKAGGLLSDSQLSHHWWIDLCLRLRKAGGQLTYKPSAEIVWLEKFKSQEFMAAGDSEAELISKDLICKKWQDWLENDPVHNANLDRNTTEPQLAYPSRQKLWQLNATCQLNS